MLLLTKVNHRLKLGFESHNFKKNLDIEKSNYIIVH